MIPKEMQQKVIQFPAPMVRLSQIEKRILETSDLLELRALAIAALRQDRHRCLRCRRKS